jgi:peptidoglycan/xylan/chitin deacetylase (PgdA/CDA1 family)
MLYTSTVRLSAILTYHSLDPSGSVISVAPELFRRQMEWLASSAIPVVSLSRIRESPGAVALTFDDGFRSFVTAALPVLLEYRLPATVFIVSGCCGRFNEWGARGRSVPRLELMDWSEIRQAASANVEIGAHGASHRNLARLDPEEVLAELRTCREVLEDKVGVSVRALAYPYGASTPAVRELAAREFPICCGTRLDFVTAQSDRADLPRLDAYYLRNWFWYRRLMRPTGKAYLAARRWLRSLNREGWY